MPTPVYLASGKERGLVTFVQSLRTRFSGDGIGLRMLVFGGASFVLLVAAGLAALDMANRAAEAERWIIHTMDVRRGARVLLVQLLDAETGERGFLLTANAKFLEPYDRALTTVPASSAADTSVAVVIATRLRRANLRKR